MTSGTGFCMSHTVCMAMDIKRDPAILEAEEDSASRHPRRWWRSRVVVISVAVSKLKPAAPSVPEGTLWFGTVKRGPMVREVRGAGTLVPEDIRWIPATTSGRVEKIILRAGRDRQARHRHPRAQQSGPQAGRPTTPSSAWRAAQAQLEQPEVHAQDHDAAAAAEWRDRRRVGLQRRAERPRSEQDSSQKQGIVAELDRQAEAGHRRPREEPPRRWPRSQLADGDRDEKSQLAPQEATVNQARASYDQFQRQLDDLQVKSTMNGLLQALVPNVEQGAQVGPGANLVARLGSDAGSRPKFGSRKRRRATWRSANTAKIDTRNGTSRAT